LISLNTHFSPSTQQCPLASGSPLIGEIVITLSLSKMVSGPETIF